MKSNSCAQRVCNTCRHLSIFSGICTKVCNGMCMVYNYITRDVWESIQQAAKCGMVNFLSEDLHVKENVDNLGTFPGTFGECG